MEKTVKTVREAICIMIASEFFIGSPCREIRELSKISGIIELFFTKR